jgi:hypothetical protein
MVKKLSVLSFRNLTNEQIEMLKEYYPHVYESLLEEHQKEYDYKYYKKITEYKKKCQLDNLFDSSKKTIIECFIRRYNLIEKIKKRGGIQYKQFLDIFFNCIMVICDDYKNIEKKINYGPVNGSDTKLPDFGSWSHLYRINTGLTESEIKSRNDFLEIPDFTTEQFIKFVNILYPKFNISHPNELNALKEIFRTHYNNRINREDIYKYLSQIGDTIGKSFFIRHTDISMYNEIERKNYSRYFRLSYYQVYKFLFVLSKEQYLSFMAWSTS